MEMEYANPLVGERHAFHIHLCHYETVGLGYTGLGPKAPQESGVALTFANFAAVWSLFYPASWQLSLKALWYNSGGQDVPLDTLPTVMPVSGSDGSTEYLGPCVRRIYHAESSMGQRRRLYLMQVLRSPLVQRVSVFPDSGGIDGRDQALIAYLSSAASGVVAPDGFPFMPQATMKTWWARPLEAVPPPTGAGPFLVSG